MIVLWFDPKVIIDLSITFSVLFLLILDYIVADLQIHNHSETQKNIVYDHSIQQLFVASSDNVPPINAPSGTLTNKQSARSGHMYSVM